MKNTMFKMHVVALAIRCCVGRLRSTIGENSRTMAKRKRPAD